MRSSLRVPFQDFTRSRLLSPPSGLVSSSPRSFRHLWTQDGCWSRFPGNASEIYPEGELRLVMLYRQEAEFAISRTAAEPPVGWMRTPCPPRTAVLCFPNSQETRGWLRYGNGFLPSGCSGSSTVQGTAILPFVITYCDMETERRTSPFHAPVGLSGCCVVSHHAIGQEKYE